MVTPAPTGQLVQTTQGHDLVLTRTLPASIREVWQSITEPERTARWIGRWEGHGSVGETAKLQLGFEEDAPWADFRITECNAPSRLRVLTYDAEAGGAWDLSLELSGADEQTELLFTMHGIDPSIVGEIGPGWEYYLDLLTSSITGAPQRSFDDYYPAQLKYYQDQTP